MDFVDLIHFIGSLGLAFVALRVLFSFAIGIRIDQHNPQPVDDAETWFTAPFISPVLLASIIFPLP